MKKTVILVLLLCLSICSRGQSNNALVKGLLSFLQEEQMSPSSSDGVVTFKYEDVILHLFGEKSANGVDVIMYLEYDYDDFYTKDRVMSINSVDDVEVDCRNMVYRFSSSVSTKSLESYKYAFYKQLRKLVGAVAVMRPSMTPEQIRQLRDDEEWSIVPKTSIKDLMTFIDGHPLSSYRHEAQVRIYKLILASYLSFVAVRNEDGKDVRLGKSEVTNSIWNIFMGGKDDNNQPVVNVTYSEIMSFIDRLNNYTAHRFRLPTGYEWEYAAQYGVKFHIDVQGLDDEYYEYCSDLFSDSDNYHCVRRKEKKKYPLNGTIYKSYHSQDSGAANISFRLAINANELN